MGLVLEIYFPTVSIKKGGKKGISVFSFITFISGTHLKLKSSSFLLTHSVAVCDGILFCFILAVVAYLENLYKINLI